MKLTFVPLAASISSPDGFQLLVKQKNKQGIFTDMMAKSFAMNFEILQLDTTTGNLPSLRTILMSIPSKECVNQSLFVSVDSDFKNPNQVNFSFIPAVQHEARQFISNMVPMLLNTYSEQNIAIYFQAEAVLRGQNCAWDSTTQTVINSDEAYLQSFQDFEEDFLADKYDLYKCFLITKTLSIGRSRTIFREPKLTLLVQLNLLPRRSVIPQTPSLMNLLEVCIQKTRH